MWTIIFKGKSYKDERDFKSILLSLKNYLENEQRIRRTKEDSSKAFKER